MEVLLLGQFAVVESWVDSSAGVHQTAVAAVLVRFDSADVELSIRAIITVLYQRTIIIHEQTKTTVCVHMVDL